MPGRGLNKKEIKSIRTETKNVYNRNPDQKKVRNLLEKGKRRDEKIAELRGMTTTLQKMNNLLTQQGLASASPKFLRAASKVVLQEALLEKGERPWSPVSIAVAQFEQEYCSLNMAGVEVMRNIEQGTKYQRKTIPARSTIQNFKRDVSAAGALLFTKPKISQYEDIVHLDAKAVIEAVLVESDWPGVLIDNGFLSAEEIKAQVDSLPPLMVDATADGAELTESRGMIVEGIKFVSPEIVNKLSPPKVSASSNSSNTVTALPITEEKEPEEEKEEEDEQQISSNLDDLILESAPNTPVLEEADPNTMHIDADSNNEIGNAVQPNEPTVQETVRNGSVEAIVGTSNGSGSEDVVQGLAQTEGEVRAEDIELAYGVQSSRAVLLTGFCHGGDNDVVNGEHNYNRLSRGLFTYMQEQSRQPFCHSNGKLYNVQIALSLDKKALQSLSGLGCGSFMNSFMCTYCPARGTDKHTQAYYRCDFCKENYDAHIPCMHRELITHDEIMRACALQDDHPLLSIILKQHISTASIPVGVLRSFIMERLHINMNSAGKDIKRCTKDELNNVVSNFWALYEVNSVNIDRVPETIISKQLECRLPHPENKTAFMEMYNVPPETCNRELLRAVLHHANRLEAARRSLYTDNYDNTSNTNDEVTDNNNSNTANTTTTTTLNTIPLLNGPKIINTIEICIMCLLHLEMRTSEKLLSLLMICAIQCRPDLSQKDKYLVVRRLEMVISSILSGGDGTITNTHTHLTSVFTLPSIAEKVAGGLPNSGRKITGSTTTEQRRSLGTRKACIILVRKTRVGLLRPPRLVTIQPTPRSTCSK